MTRYLEIAICSAIILCVAQVGAAGNSRAELAGRAQEARMERGHHVYEVVGDNSRGDIDNADEISLGSVDIEKSEETDAEISGITEPAHESPQDHLMTSLGYWSAARVHKTNGKKGIAALMYERAAMFREKAGEFKAAAVIYYIALKVYEDLGDKEKVAEMRLNAEAAKTKEMSRK